MQLNVVSCIQQQLFSQTLLNKTTVYEHITFVIQTLKKRELTKRYKIKSKSDRFVNSTN